MEFPCVVYRDTDFRIAANEAEFDDYLSDGWVHWATTITVVDEEEPVVRKRKAPLEDV
jgi:hypothetical protein